MLCFSVGEGGGEGGEGNKSEARRQHSGWRIVRRKKALQFKKQNLNLIYRSKCDRLCFCR